MALRHTALVVALAATFAAPAFAQSAAPEVPNPVHPFPANPVATNGASLSGMLGDQSVFTGRSAYIDRTQGPDGTLGGLLPFGR